MNMMVINMDRNETFNVVYHNHLAVPTLIHAHGQMPPAFLDGVPYLSSLALLPGAQTMSLYHEHGLVAGTFFAHAHYGMQHGQGLAVPLIVKTATPASFPQAAEIEQAADLTVFLEDVGPYIHGEPEVRGEDAVMAHLRAAWAEVADNFDYGACPTAAMHAHVQYEHHLANGLPLDRAAQYNIDAGRSVRLRLINGAGSTNYKVDFGGLQGRVVAVDGQLVVEGGIPPNQPQRLVEVLSVWVGVAQRIDILLEIPRAEGISYMIEAIAEGAMGPTRPRSGVILLVEEPPIDTAQLSLTTNRLPGMMDMSLEMRLTSFEFLAAPLDADSLGTFEMNLTGTHGINSVNRRSWIMPPVADQFCPNPDPLLVVEGETYCVFIQNFDSHAHSIHLHGHPFRVVEVDGTPINGALRDTIMLPGGCWKAKICFLANNPGAWAFHCHMMFHMALGGSTNLWVWRGVAWCVVMLCGSCVCRVCNVVWRSCVCRNVRCVKLCM